MMYKTNPSKGRRLTALLVIPAMAVGCLATEFPAVASIIGSTSDISIMAENDDKVNNFIPDSESNTGLIIAAEENITATAPSTPEINGGTESETAVTAKSESISPEDDDKVYTSADVLAEFPGSMPGLMKWIGENMHYPENAYKNGIQGRVIVKLVIGKDGSVKDTKIIKGVDKELDKESLRLVKSMPKWKPAEIDGKPVASYFTMPISFKIKDNSTSTNEAVKEAKPTTDLIYNTLKKWREGVHSCRIPGGIP
ncbi:energy transducer TonB [Lepagella muris]|uniref:Energy transducer TonB n=1 Tax=Lepagella muris TaxID=3032870 RepID=A0AC61RB84_9BACT|nr:energy transducer TonB [Lepagella muris]TGY76469.1 energy transducer TonB [Lepagella muris]THG47641.1 energy transducer TonB [Bacteroidales bacterium]TKC54995.1 energy transducer TonB [Bacteroidales bacterium]